MSGTPFISFKFYSATPSVTRRTNMISTLNSPVTWSEALFPLLYKAVLTRFFKHTRFAFPCWMNAYQEEAGYTFKSLYVSESPR